MKNPWSIGDAQADWTWKGQEGKPVEVEVFSPGAEVELFVNGVSVGRKKAGEETGYRADFETVYEPGIISAAAYDIDGSVVGRHELKTADGNRRLLLEEEKPESVSGAESGSQESCLKYIDIRICDALKTAAWDEKWTLEASVDGGCEIIGFGSGDICPAYNYNSTVTETCHGRALLILKRREGARQSRVMVRAEGHDEKSIIVNW